MTWREFLQHNADKILLLIILHGMLALLVTNLGNPVMIDWLKGEVGTVLGALLMLITGRALRPDPSVSTTTTSSVTVPADPANPTNAATPQK